ncbi:E3 ubiquitin/ISG15 ligase TRIM25-like isoform X3 [Petromyzon marinus]|uniref:E3 ubiquitin/ISG15 ligase TRIM25-like isoform X3 n=1 Tax=Petromyzon marinus TaxID=7757 RepID=UPI003F7059B4
MSTPTAAASEELICSICLGAFHCPSTLSCGHSFCLRCLEDAWQVAGRCFCPQCRAEFEQKPQLSRNVALANLVVELSVGEKAAPQVSCDSCLVGEVPAVRSCLTCEASLCESHCKRHLQNARFKDHELVELGVSVEARTCKMHKESLRFYCTQDESLVCTSCAIVGEHTGHKFSSVEDAHESRKEELRLEKTRREENKKTAASHTQSLREDYQRVQESLRGTKEGISREFERRREQLREEEREALECVDEEGRFVLSRIQADIARYESRVCSLEREINQLLAALAMQDPLSFLQELGLAGDPGCPSSHIQSPRAHRGHLTRRSEDEAHGSRVWTLTDSGHKLSLQLPRDFLRSQDGDADQCLPEPSPSPTPV